MLTFKKRFATIIFLALLSAATLVSCGKQGNTESSSSDSTEHPSDTTEHPAGTNEHPADSTANQ